MLALPVAECKTSMRDRVCVHRACGSVAAKSWVLLKGTWEMVRMKIEDQRAKKSVL
jgi:hypothetical protein